MTLKIETRDSYMKYVKRLSSLHALFIILALITTVIAKPAEVPQLAKADTVPPGLTVSSWSEIRSAYQQHRHQVARTAGGYRAHNPEQQWLTEFDEHGFITRPEAGDWSWGLELRSYGFPGEKRQIGSATPGRMGGDRITFQRDAGLYEWFVNDLNGLEHGFTIAKAPADGDGEQTRLEFDLRVRGNLRPEISADRSGLSFLDPQGKAAVTYSKLRAWDAEGKNLPAHFVAQPDGLRLLVEVTDAHYPITIDPIAQQAYLKSSDPMEGDHFGYSVAVSGDTVVVGGERSRLDPVISDRGVYIFVRDAAGWTQQAFLKPSASLTDDNFGFSVAISGDTVVIGAPSEDSDATGIDGDPTNDNAPGAGAALVFVRHDGTWSQQAYLKASNTETNDAFGWSVTIDDDTVVVSTPGEDSNATGVNGDQTNNNSLGAGAAYVYVRNGETWHQEAYLKASHIDHYDAFGGEVAVSGNTIVVGAPGEDSDATRINGDQSNNQAKDSGAAYVFVRDGDVWNQQAYLKASNAEGGDDYQEGDYFGDAVAISGDTVVVGAYAEDSDATGINGDQMNNHAVTAGAVYVYVRDGSTWTQQAYLKASNTEDSRVQGDLFGWDVAFDGSTLAVGAIFEDSSATGINGDQMDNSADSSGAVYLFVRNGDKWSQEAYVKASNTGGGIDDYNRFGDWFGSAVAVSGNTLIVGAIFEESNAVGVNGDQTDDSVPYAGAAYVFNLPTILRNISARVRIETDDNVLIGGFIVTGSQTKQVLIRGIGPSLLSIDALTDPALELYDSTGTVVASNDNWMDSQDREEIIDTEIPPTDDRESAIFASLDPGAYTAVMRGANQTTGIGLVEAYDLDGPADSELVNISARALVQTGDNVMIAGFIVGGPSGQEVLIRAIGPSLPLEGSLANPTLELYDENGMLLASNDDWRDTQEAEIIATEIPPPDDAESAVVQSFSPAAYTAIVRGKNDTIGIALVEVYKLN